MMLTTPGSVFRLLAWQWRGVLLYASAATVVVLLHVHVWPAARLPALPLGIVGGALGIFVSFRTNSAYGRWWEGRQLWGRLVNASRMLASQAVAYCAPTDEGRTAAEALVRRHVAYVHVLRATLRQQDPWADAHVVRALPEAERARLARETNACHALVA